MGVKRPWLTWALVGGLVTVFAGARVFNAVAVLDTALVVAGLAAVGVAKALRFVAWRGAAKETRGMEAVFMLGYAGCALALVGFVPATEFGVNLLGLEFEAARPELRFKRFFLVSSLILLVCSLLPVLAAQWAVSKGGSAGAARVDTLRVRHTAGGALSTALLALSLIFIGYITTEFNRSADFSYFKTATPGESVRQIVLNMDGPLRVALFYPDVNEVKDELLVYLNELERVTGKVVIEEYDRFVDIEAATEWRAGAEGEIFLGRGDSARESIFVGLDMATADGTLRVLDRRIHEKLLLLNRERRVVYLTTGHGELNDPLAGTEPGGEPRPYRGELSGDQLPLQTLRADLRVLNYQVQDLGLVGGLGDEVPGDAAMLMIIGPQRPFHESEIAAVRRYLDGGGSVLMALETGSQFTLDGLRDHFPFDFQPAMTLHDQFHLRSQRPSPADRRLIVTNRFTTHPSVRTAGRQSGLGMHFVGAGSFAWRDSIPGIVTEAVIESALDSYADLNGNFTFDEDSEERGSYVLGVAVEREGTAGMGGTGSDAAGAGMRALLLADAEIFLDQMQVIWPLNGDVIEDAVRWLDQEEAFIGGIVSEEDVPVLHTRAENVVWFYAIIFGAPAALLALGLGLLYARSRQLAADEPEARTS